MIRRAGILLALLLMLLLSLSLAEEPAPLGWAELNVWAQECLNKARAQTPLNDPNDAEALTEDGYAFVYDFATLYMSRPDLGDGSVLQGILVLDVEQAGPRGVDTAMSLPEALSLFCNENPLLIGGHDGAVLYAHDGPEGFLWGYLQRDGQRAGLVQYAVHVRLADGITDAGLLLTVQDQGVAAIRIYGLANRITDADLNATREFVEVQAEAEDYERVPSSLFGDEVTRFSEADLAFSGIDLLSVTPETAGRALGEAEGDETVQDETGLGMRTLRYNECELVFGQKADGTWQLLFFSCEESDMEGPRGVRIGDTLTDVMSRFAVETSEGGALYGKAGEAPYGTVEFGEDASAVLRYAVKVPDGRTALLLMHFERLELCEYFIYLAEEV